MRLVNHFEFLLCAPLKFKVVFVAKMSPFFSPIVLNFRTCTSKIGIRRANDLQFTINSPFAFHVSKIVPKTVRQTGERYSKYILITDFRFFPVDCAHAQALN